jgi:hypothetical protein
MSDRLLRIIILLACWIIYLGVLTILAMLAMR